MPDDVVTTPKKKYYGFIDENDNKPVDNNAYTPEDFLPENYNNTLQRIQKTQKENFDNKSFLGKAATGVSAGSKQLAGSTQIAIGQSMYDIGSLLGNEDKKYERFYNDYQKGNINLDNNNADYYKKKSENIQKAIDTLDLRYSTDESEFKKLSLATNSFGILNDDDINNLERLTPIVESYNTTRRSLEEQKENNDIVSELLSNGGTTQDVLNKAKQAEQTDTFSEKLIKKGTKTMSDMPYGSGFWFEAGQMLPQIGLTLGAVASAPLTNGSSLSALPEILGLANVGMITASSTGNAIYEYQQYQKSKGREIDDADMWGSAILAGMAEIVPELIRMEAILKPLKKIAGKTIAKEVVEKFPGAGRKLLTRFAETDPAMYKKFIGRITSNATQEGVEEAITEVAQNLTQRIYQDEGDWADWKQILSNTGRAFKAGALMGGFIGPFEHFSINKIQQQNRQKTGFVNLVQTKTNGKVYEIINSEGNTLFGYDAMGRPVEVDKSEISDNITVSTEQFNNFVNTYRDNKKEAKQIEREIYAQKAKENINEYVNGIINKNTGQVIGIDGNNGETYYVVDGDPDSNNPANLVYAVNAKDIFANPELLDKTLIKNITRYTPDELKSQLEEQASSELSNDELDNTEEQAINNLQEEEAINEKDLVEYEGKPYTVKSIIGNDYNIQQIDEEGNILEDLIVSGDQLQKANVTNETIPQSTQQNLPRLIIGEGDKQIELNVTKEKEGSYTVGDPITNSRIANQNLSLLTEKYPNLNFEVINQADQNNEFAENQFIIKATSKNTNQTGPQYIIGNEIIRNKDEFIKRVAELKGQENTPRIDVIGDDETMNQVIDILKPESQYPELEKTIDSKFQQLENKVVKKQNQKETNTGFSIDEYNNKEINWLENAIKSPNETEENKYWFKKDLETIKSNPSKYWNEFGLSDDGSEREKEILKMQDYYKNNSQNPKPSTSYTSENAINEIKEARKNKYYIGDKQYLENVKSNLRQLENQPGRENDIQRLKILQSELEKIDNPVKSKRNKPKKLTPNQQLLNDFEPQSFKETVLHYFANGGRINTKDFVDMTGYMPGSPEFKSFIWAIKNDERPLDMFFENKNTFGKENEGAMDMQNEIIDILKEFSGKKAMREEIQKIYNQRTNPEAYQEQFVPEDQEAAREYERQIAELEAERNMDEYYSSLDAYYSEFYRNFNGDFDNINWDDLYSQFYDSFSPEDINTFKNETINKEGILQTDGTRQIKEGEQRPTSGNEGDRIRGTAEKELQQAASEVDTNPTEAQKEAGNYKKGHVTIQGFDITIENPKGSTRSGVDEDGNKWENVIHSHYGYYKGTKGIDGDQIDVFIGDNPESKKIFVVDQVNPKTGEFDEHKVMMGYNTIEDAESAYLDNYDENWKGLGGITETNVDTFKEWALNGTKKQKPFADYKTISDSGDYVKLRTWNINVKPLEKFVNGRLAYNLDFDHNIDNIVDTYKYHDAFKKKHNVKSVTEFNKGEKFYDIYMPDNGTYEIIDTKKNYTIVKNIESGVENKNYGGDRRYLPIANLKNENDTIFKLLKTKIDEGIIKLKYIDSGLYAVQEQRQGWNGGKEYYILDRSGIPTSFINSQGQRVRVIGNSLKEITEKTKNILTKGGKPINNNTSNLENKKELTISQEQTKVEIEKLIEEKTERLNTVQQLLNKKKKEFENRKNVQTGMDLGKKPEEPKAEQQSLFDVVDNFEKDNITRSLDSYKNEIDNLQREILQLQKNKDKYIDEAKNQQELNIEPENNYGKKNKVFTEDAKNAALERLRKKRNNLKTGIDPQEMIDAVTVAGYHIEAGARKFVDFAKNMIEDAGDWIKPYLKGLYENIRRYPGMEEVSQDLDNTEFVDKYNLDNLDNDVNISNLHKNTQDVEQGSGNIKSDSGKRTDEVRNDLQDVQGNRTNSQQNRTDIQAENREGKQLPGSKSNNNSSSTSTRTQSNKQVSTESEQESEIDFTRNIDGRGRSIISTEGNNVEQGRYDANFKDVEEFAGNFAEKVEKKRQLQKKVENKPHKLMDENNIRETLPFLLPDQQDDVIKAENRFYSDEHKTFDRANGKAIMFTNGTGTGKTYTGLGVVKRFVKQGKDDILIVTPTAPKVNDWAHDGKNLNLNITPLVDTNDKGTGAVVTTFANFRSNDKLKERDFDLIVYDESHRLMEDKKGEHSSTTYAHYQISNRDEWHALQRILSIEPNWIREKELKNAISEKEKSRNNLDMMDFVYQQSRDEQKVLEEELKQIEAKQKELLPKYEKRAKEAAEKTKVVFLSATPFKAHFNLRYANGYLFDWGNETTYQEHSRVDAESRFYLDNFGSAYEWKYHRLQTKSDANAEAIAMQEMEFAKKLMNDGVMSGRVIESEMDYSREFPKVSGKFNSTLFNKGFSDIYDYETNSYDQLRSAAREVFFDYNYTTQLFESLKTSMSIDRIKKHLDIGRKVVVFHRRQQANVNPPFESILLKSTLNAQAVLRGGEEYSDEAKEKAKTQLKQVESFKSKYGDLLDYEKTLNYNSATEQIAAEFGTKAVYINGRVSKANKSRAIKEFNEDGSGKDIIVVQEEAGKEGISLHDTSGKYQRVLINLSMPVSSITALQIEGRIYRIGQESNAIFEYPLLGLDLEVAYFGQNINRRLSTTENLAVGDQSRDLIRSFAEGVLFNSSADEPSLEQGIGGKEYDKREQEAKSDFQKSILVYNTNQKQRGKRDQRQGLDYFPTPEPVGQKMVEWLYLKNQENALEPSAGHGAIAMWVPTHANITAIEPSYDLFAKLNARAGGGNRKILNTKFEDYHLINKHEGIVMNPPFGHSGATAMEHVEKAFHHLKDRGRLIAIVPRGAMDKKIDKFLYGKDDKGNLINPDAYLRAEIILPSVTFDQAGTKVSSRIIVIDKISKPGEEYIEPTKKVDLSNIDKINDLFDAIEFINIPGRLENNQHDNSPTATVKEEKPIEVKETTPTSYVVQKHSKSGEELHTVVLNDKVEKDVWFNYKSVAKKFGGYYSRYNQEGMKPGFIFNSDQQAKSFQEKISGDNITSYKRKSIGEDNLNASYKNIVRPSRPQLATEVFEYRDKLLDFENEIQKVVHKYEKELNVKINVIKNEKGLPEYIQKDMKAKKMEAGEIPGVYDNINGNVYLLTYNLEDTKEAEEIILHEVVGHKGMKGLLGNEYDGVMSDIYDFMNDSDIDRLSDIYNTKDKYIIAEEYVAEIAEEMTNQPLLKRIIARIREALRKLFNLKYNDKDIVRLLKRSRDYLKTRNNTKETTQKNPASYKAKSKERKPIDAKKFVETKKDKFLQAIQDNKLALKNFQNHILELGGKITDKSNPYMEENLSQGKVLYQQKKFEEEYETPLLKEAKQFSKLAGIDLKALNKYMIAKHAIERNEYIRKEKLDEFIASLGGNFDQKLIEEKRKSLQDEVFSGMSDEDAKVEIDQVENSIKHRDIKKFWDAVKNATNFTIEAWRRYGFLDSKQLESLKNRYRYYVPLRGWEPQVDDIFEYQQGIGNGFNFINKAKGRKSLSDDPLPYILNMAHSAIVAGEKNLVKQKAFNLVNQNLKVLDKLAKANPVYSIKTGVIEGDGKEQVIETIVKPPRELFVNKRVASKYTNQHKVRKTPYQAKQHEVELFWDGDKYVLVFQDPEVARAINNVEKNKYLEESTRLLTNTIGKFTRYLASVYTSLNPDFIIANIARDVPLAVVSHYVEGNIKQSAALISNLRRANKAIIRKGLGKTNINNNHDDYLYQTFRELGGETGFVHLKDIDAFKSRIKRNIKRLSRSRAHPIEILRYGFEAIEALAQWSENMTRFATFLTSVEQKDKSYKQAAYDAKNVTVNFNKKGRYSGSLGSLYAFFNAGIQGVKRYTDLWKANPAKMATVHAILMSQGYLASLLLDLWGGDDDDDVRKYDKISDFKKQNYLLFNVPGDKDYVSIPMPHIMRFWHSLGVIAYDLATERINSSQAVLKGLGNLPKDLIPIDIGGVVNKEGEISPRPVIPTSIVPIYDLAVNENFMGSPVYKTPYTVEQQLLIADSKRYFRNVNQGVKKTTDLLFKLGGGDNATKYYYKDGETKKVSNAFDVNPEWVEHLFEGYFGGTGKFINQVAKTATNVITAGNDVLENKKMQDIVKDIDLNDLPIIYRFLGQAYKDPIRDEFYKLKSESSIVDALLKAYRSSSDVNYDKFEELAKSELNMNNLKFKQFNKLIKDISNIERKLYDTDNDDLINELEQQKHDLMKEIVNTVKK